MCGIAGIVTKQSQVIEKELLSKMGELLAHRGPDHMGIQQHDPCHLVHRRLNIIDCHARSNQPFLSKDQRYLLSYNGEVYNFQSLRQELETLGHSFETTSDTEVIVQAWQQWEEKSILKLRGMFAFAIWDFQEHSLFLCRDRIGKKPLFYTNTPEFFAFASEMKSLRIIPGFQKQIDYDAMNQYLVHGFINAPHSIYQNTHKLEPGHYLKLQDGKTSVVAYHHLSFTPKLQISEEEAVEQAKQLILEATKLRMISDVPLGAFLSGGIDSSLIVAMMAEMSSQPVKTFSIGFEQSDFNEQGYARMIAERYQTDHTELTVTPDAASLFPKLVHHFDEPIADSSAIPVYLLSELTRQHVVVALTGDGGDEMMAGYKRYKGMYYADYYQHVPRWMRSRLKQALEFFPENTNMNSFVRNLKWLNTGSFLDQETRFSQTLNFFSGGYWEKLLTPDIRQKLQSQTPEDIYTPFFEDHGITLAERMMQADIHCMLPSDIITKVERMSMAHSLEARSPLLDQEFVSFCAQLPSQLKYRYPQLKYILKKVSIQYLPHEVVYRKKQGFGIPIGSWFRNELKDFLQDHLNQSTLAQAGICQQSYIHTLIQEHLSGQRNHQSRLWNLLYLEIWNRLIHETQH